MAQKDNQAAEVKYCCSVCLDLLKDPVTIPCGHNYCMSCIKSHWDEEDQRGTHSCPQCRKTFISRPELVKNTMLADLVEDLKKIGLQAAPADHCYAGPEDVACDVCTGRKLKAIKSCLVCLVSYCENHLQPHYESAAFQKHKVIDASKKLRENICSRHDEVMKMFCRTDQQCICYLCSVDEHKGHDTVSAAAERTGKQKELELSRQVIQQSIQTKEEEVKALQQQVVAIIRCANKAVLSTDKISSELNHLIGERCSDVKQQIRSKQNTEVSEVKEFREKLEQEIAELRRKDAELEELSYTEDHTQFLQSFPPSSQLPASPDSPNTNLHHRQQDIEDIVAAMTVARDRIQATLSEVFAKESPTEPHMDVSLPEAEPKTRAEFLQLSSAITLDPDTAGSELMLSNGNRKVTKTTKQPRPAHPDRFNCLSQVMSKNQLTGRCYWEVERKGKVSIVVTYKDIERSGEFNASAFGYNKSWALTYDNSYTFRHSNLVFVTGSQLSKIGVYLDHGAGILSFYSISETMTLLHRVQTTFTEPLYAGLWLHGSEGDTAEVCHLKK